MTKETNRSAAIKDLKRLCSDGSTIYYVDRYNHYASNYAYLSFYCISIFNSQPMNINNRIVDILDVEYEPGGSDIVIPRDKDCAERLIGSLGKILGLTLKAVML